MATCLIDLPTELISYLFQFLPGDSLPAAATVCRRFHDAVMVEAVWHRRCAQEFGVSKVDGSTYYDIYTKILYRYGKTQGLWQANRGPYGGLLQVKFDKNELVGTNYDTPVSPHVTLPLQKSELFRIYLKENNEVEVQCRRKTPHNCTINILNKQGGDELQYKCPYEHLHRHPNGLQAEMFEWLDLQMSWRQDDFLPDNFSLLKLKFDTLLKYDGNFTCKRICVPCPEKGVLIQPGLFVGDYSHGNELFLLTYNMEKTAATLCKITGDPNVPAGEVSVAVDLGRPLFLTAEEQQCFRTLLSLETSDRERQPAEEIDIDKVPLQPFRMPHACNERSVPVPKQCRARFQSKVQLAHHGFQNPHFSPGHWIVFDADTFGHLFLELSCFSMYSRVKEDFS